MTRSTTSVLLALALLFASARAGFASELVTSGAEHPRDAVRALIEGVLAHDVAGTERAVGALDLARIPEDERSARGPELAVTLKEDVLDRLGRVEYAEIGDPPSDDVGTRFTWTHGTEATRRVPIAFARLEDGWRFAAEFVARVPRLADELADLAIAEDVLAGLPLADRLRHELRGRMPAPLLERAFLLENWQWLALLALVILGVVGDRVARFVLARIARRIEGSSRVSVDAEVLADFERPFGICVTAGLFVWLLPAVGIERSIERILDLAGSFVLVLSGIWAAYRLVDVFCGFLGARAERTANKFDDMLVPLLRRTLKIMVSIVGLVFIASRLSEDVWHILAGLSIGSLAVGFAAKDSIENLFGTFTVLMDKPFQLGDWVTVGDIDGTVEEVGFRSTRVRTFHNSLITVPNSRFISAHVDNMGERRYRRVKTMLSLTYDTPAESVEAFCEGVRELIRRHPYTRKDSFYVYFNAWSASSIDVLLYAFLECPDWGTELREKHRLYCDVLRLADRVGVSFAFPTQTIHMAQPGDLEHSDRPGDVPAGVAAGRTAAEEIASAGLAGFDGPPPPFSIESVDSQASAPAGHSERDAHSGA